MASLELAFDILARDKASDTFNNVGDKADNLGSRLKGALVAGAAAGAVAVGAFALSSIQAFADAEQSQQRLTDAFDKFPLLADTSKEALDRLNASLAAKTKFDDDATASGQAVLAQFGLTGKQITELTPLLQDYAAKTGKDIPTAAEELGKAMLGQGRALKGVGIDFKDTGDAGGNFDQVMAGLRTQVGGFAEKEGETAQGKLQILQNRFGEVQEKVGEKLLPVLLRFGDWLINTGIPFAERMAEKIGAFAGKVAGAYQDIADFVNDTKRDLDTIVGFVSGLPGRIASAAAGMWDGIKDAFRGAINWIIDKWNALQLRIGGQDIDLPFGMGFAIPSITLNTPDIPRLHGGGEYRSPGFNGEGLALLRDREQVTTPETMGQVVARLDALIRMVERQTDTQVRMARSF